MSKFSQSVQVGYLNALTDFLSDTPASIVRQLTEFVPDSGDSQINAWRDSIRLLQRTLTSFLEINREAAESSVILLEYRIPLESRRIDAVLLLPGIVLTVEFKGKAQASQADIDQATAYARDLRAYHRDCADTPVRCLLLLTRYQGSLRTESGIDILGPDHLATYLNEQTIPGADVLSPTSFVSPDAYQPLPSLVEAARELFKSGSLTRIHRAAAATEPTLNTCSTIVHKTAKARRRALILICGVPGAGKTLVGLQFAHAKYLDDLAVIRSNGEKPTAAAVFLSGNGPLVEVLQYELRSAGGDGKTFVRGVHDYVKSFTARKDLVPPQHVLIYDEAQRAFDAAQVQAKHQDLRPEFHGLSEPELFIQFAERIPEWCVVVGLIGSGQEIHIGEEAGLVQWRSAIERSTEAGRWDIYVPSNPEISSIFGGMNHIETSPTLELSTTIRFHLATRLHEFVECVLSGKTEVAQSISHELEANGFHLRLTHNLESAQDYLRHRYDRDPEARFGMIASSKDKDLVKFGIPKGFKSPGEVGPGKYGKWYSEALATTGSCTRLESVATEFGAQGLELDGVLLAWGTDLIRQDGLWVNTYASGYRDKHRIQDAKALRINAYRVLLTRGRDCCVVFTPPVHERMRETYRYLRNCGFRPLHDEDEL